MREFGSILALALLIPSCGHNRQCVNGKCNYITRLLFRSPRDKQKVTNSSMKIRASRKAGFTLVEIMIVVAIIGLLAAIAIPNFVKARTTSQQNACINNLRQYDGAVQQWALENKKDSTATYTMTSIQPYVKLDSSGNLPACP